MVYMEKKSKNLIEIHLAVFLFGIAGLFGKLLHLPAIIIALGRVLFAAFALLMLLLYKNQRIKLSSRKDYFYLIVMGIILAVHWAAFFHSIQISTIAIGLIAFSTFPVFAAFIEPYFFKEKIKYKNILMALITLIGIVLIIPKYELGNNTAQGAIWGIISGLTFAVLQTMNRKYVKKYSSLIITFYQVGIASIALLPFLFYYNIAYNLKDILLLALLGIVFTAVAHSLFIKGLNNIKVQTASIIASLEPVYGIIFAIIFIKEIPTLKVIIGGFIILSTSLYATIQSNFSNHSKFFPDFLK